MCKLLLLGVALLAVACPPKAEAQTAVALWCNTGVGINPWAPCSTSNPVPVTTSGGSGNTTTMTGTTVTVTNTFQQVLASNVARKGCTIQNTGTHLMYVFFGPIGSATLTNSFQIAATQAIYCGVQSDGIASDQVSITGTSGDPFVVASQ